VLISLFQTTDIRKKPFEGVCYSKTVILKLETHSNLVILC